MLDAQGHPENRAGSHPDRLEIDFALSGENTIARDLEFDFPPGFSGNPNAVPQCSRELFEAGKEDCPPESQVGLFRFTLEEGGKAELPIFQLEPGPDEFIAFASTRIFKIPLRTELRPSDFGISMKANDLPRQAVTEGHMEMWGVPADHQVGTTIPRRAMLTTPTRCGPLVFSFHTRSWQEGASWVSASSDTGAPLEGCADLAFSPDLALRLSNPVADSPTGVQIELTTPEETEVRERADALVKNVTVELPDGITVSPGGAAGLTACSDAQLDLGSTGEAHCPLSSKVGTVEFVAPGLNGSLKGTVYLGAERPPERLRVFVVAPGPGIVVKFVGVMRVDPVTGRLTTTLADLAEMPFRRLSLNFDGGPGALLATPLACGPAAAVGKFEPYGGSAPVESRSSVAIAARIPGSQCPGAVPFAPRLTVHSSRHRIGRPTTLSVALLRQDGEQVPRRFALTLPAGLSAGLGSVEACTDAAAAAGACPAASRVGGALAKIGSGPSPVALRGDAYVTGPYRRAPFGILLHFRAATGPLDLGTMSLRAAATVDGKTGRVTILADPLPEKIEGLPVRFQTIELNMDRPGLVRNPTSCRPAAVDATIESSSGALATASSPLLLRGCKRLGFRPRFRISLDDSGEGQRRGNPGLRIVSRMRSRDTGLRAMKMALPKALGFDIAGLEEICSRPDAARGSCPAGARVGTAAARTTLLSRPLKGAIYIVQPKGNGLPELGISLVAMGMHVNISGRTASQDGQFVTSLVGLPDMPISTFTMRMEGGEEGVFSLGTDLCKRGKPRRLASTIAATGQDGTKLRSRVPVETNARCR